MRSNRQKLSVGQQIFRMRSLFPQFKYQRQNQCPTWIGSLKPNDKSPIYQIKIIYPYPFSPKIWILSPSITDQPLHRYKDDSLCLYYPKDRTWHTGCFIAEIIVPLTAEWLSLYELWKLTGNWYADEAPHSSKK